MDANRCISYLTIEKRGAIPEDLRPGIGRQIFGCDICQDVCPWNRRAPIAADPDLAAPQRARQPRARKSRRHGRAGVRAPLQRLAVRRARWTGFRRNLAIAMGNSGQTRFLPRLLQWAADTDPVVAEAAAWAVENLRRMEYEGERL